MKVVDYEPIGARIREKREEFGYTREEFAEMLDISPKFCSDIELGLMGMSLNTLINISKNLYISTDYILSGVETDKDSSRFMFLIEQIPDKDAENVVDILEKILRIINNNKVD